VLNLPTMQRSEGVFMSDFAVVIPTASPPGFGPNDSAHMIKLDGRECLLRTVELFLNREQIAGVFVVFDPAVFEEAKKKFGGHFSFSGVKMVTGGTTWHDQLATASAKIPDAAKYILVHDAARPAVAYSDIDLLLEEAPKHPMTALTTPIRATVLELDESGAAIASHRSTAVAAMVTPMVFSRDAFLNLCKTKSDPHPSEWRMIKGHAMNLRAGGPNDAAVMNAALRLLPKPKIKGPSNPFEEASW
jgi:2-C-methyl-D-erythritol 4-phosphate cytidylyltransferase